MTGSAPPFRLAVAGTGRVYPLYARAVALRDDVEIAAVVHPRGDHADPSVARVPDVRSLLTEGPPVDALVVLSPAEFHAGMTIEALAGGLHVLVEKPVGLNLAEIEAMIQVRNQSGRVCAPAHTYLYDDGVRAAETLIAACALGRISFAQARYLKAHPEAMSAAFPPILHQHGIHLFYLMQRLLGRPDHVQATLRRTRYEAPDMDDLALVTLVWPDGAIGQITIAIGVGAWATPGGWYGFDLFGAAGSYHHDWGQSFIDVPDAGLVSAPYALTFEQLLDAFVRSCRGEAALRSTLEDARDAERIRAAAVESAAAGGWVEIVYDGSALTPNPSPIAMGEGSMSSPLAGRSGRGAGGEGTPTERR